MVITETYNSLFLQPSNDGIRSEVKRKYLFMSLLMLVVMVAVAGIASLDGEVNGDVVLAFLVPGIVVFGINKWMIIPMVEQKCILIQRGLDCIYVNDSLKLPVISGEIVGFSIKGKKFTLQMNGDFYLRDSLELYPNIEPVLQNWLQASDDELPAGDITDITYYHLTVRGIFIYIRNALTEKLEYSDDFYSFPEKEQERLKEQNKKHALWYLTFLNGVPLILVFIGAVIYMPYRGIFDSFQQGLMWIIFGFYFVIIQSYSLLFFPALQKVLTHTEDRYNRKKVKSLG